MVYVTELWLPIVLSAVAVFVVSFIIHMLLPYHKSDYKKLPNEENLLEVLRKASVTPGTYFFPHCMSHKEMKSPEVMEKFKKGPGGAGAGAPERPADAAEASRAMVRLLPGDKFLRRLPDRPHRGRRRRVPGGLPRRGHGRFPRLRRRSPP